MPVRHTYGFNYTRLWQALAAFSLMLLALVVWNLKLAGAIRGRKRAEAAQSVAETRFRLLFEQSPDGIVIIEPETARILQFNEKAHRQLGYSHEEFAQLRIPDFDAVETREETRTRIAKTIGEGRSDFETLHRTKQGEIRNVRVTAQFTEILGRKVYHCVWRDITEHKQAEEALQKAHQKLQTTLNSITDGLLVLDHNWRFTYFSEPGAKMIGMRQEELMGRCVWDLFPDVKDTKFYENYHRVVETGQPMHFEDYYPAPINKWLDCYCYPSPDGLSVYFHDITERKQAEETLRQSRRAALNLMTDAIEARGRSEQMSQALRASEALYRSLFESMLNGFAYCKMLFEEGRPSDFVYLTVNRAFEQLTGLSGVTGKRVTEVIPGIREADPGLFERYGRVAMTGNPETFEIYVASLKDWYSLTVYCPEPEYFVVVFDIITARKQAEAAIRELNRSLEQRVQERTAELLAANQELNAFAYAASHDLRQPLRAMNGFSQALVEDFGATLPDAAHEFLNQITQASRRMGELIDGLLRLSRSTRGELRRDAVDLSALAARLLGELAATEPNRRVTWTVAPGLTARGDEQMIAVVLANLLGNAWKYTARQPEAKIEVGVMDPCCDGVAPPAQNANTPTLQHSNTPIPQYPNTPVFFVRDNGAGFDMQHAVKLFQPFQRLHREDEFPGIGIGLATVESKVGRGTTFQIYLPATETVGQSPEAAAVKPKPRGGTETILLVEDEAAVRLLTRAVLERSGYRVLEAPDGVEALRIGEQNQDAIRLLLTDLVMPEGVSGIELAARLQARDPRLRVIFTSGYSADIAGRELSLQDRQNFIQKPSSPEQLLETVRQCLDKQ